MRRPLPYLIPYHISPQSIMATALVSPCLLHEYYILSGGLPKQHAVHKKKKNAPSRLHGSVHVEGSMVQRITTTRGWW